MNQQQHNLTPGTVFTVDNSQLQNLSKKKWRDKLVIFIKNIVCYFYMSGLKFN